MISTDRPLPLLARARHRWAQALRRPGAGLRAVATAAALLLAALVLLLGARPVAVGLVADGWDNVAHMALHFVLCHILLLAVGLQRGGWAVASCAAFAAVDEWTQQFSPGRSVSLADALADVAGALLALASAHALAWHQEVRALQRAAWLRRQMALWLRPPR